MLNVGDSIKQKYDKIKKIKFKPSATLLNVSSARKQTPVAPL